jgi:hypothetical protein
MRNYPEVAVTGFARRAVFARFPYPELRAGAGAEEVERYLQEQRKMTAAVFADPDVALGRAIEDALNVALKRAFDAGVRDPDGLAQAAADDPDVCEAINRPGAAREILRQLVGLRVAAEIKEELEDEGRFDEAEEY